MRARLLRALFTLDFASAGSDATPDRFTFAILNADLFGIAEGPGGEFFGIDLRVDPVAIAYPGTDAFGDPLGSNCFLGVNFTSHELAAPVAVSAGQIVQVRVLFSFN